MGTMKKNDVYRDIEQNFGQVPGWIRQMPEPALEGFWNLMRDFTLAETTIPNKYKELIGVAVSGATRCRYCALFHTEAARLHGATDEEIAEASMLAGHTMMSSTYIHAQQIDYDVFRKETLGMVAFAKANASARKSTPAHRTESTRAERGRH